MMKTILFATTAMILATTAGATERNVTTIGDLHARAKASASASATGVGVGVGKGGDASTGPVTVEGDDTPAVQWLFGTTTAHGAGRAPELVPGQEAAAVNRSFSVPVVGGGASWDELVTTPTGALAILGRLWPETVEPQRAYACQSVDGIADAVHAAGLVCPGRTIGELR